MKLINLLRNKKLNSFETLGVQPETANCLRKMRKNWQNEGGRKMKISPSETNQSN
jgi:hypothetical protein